MEQSYPYQDVILTIDYRFTSFSVTLQQWIDKHMYTDSRWYIREIRHRDGRELPGHVIPLKYQNRQNGYYFQHTLAGKLMAWLRSLFSTRNSEPRP